MRELFTGITIMACLFGLLYYLSIDGYKCKSKALSKGYPDYEYIGKTCYGKNKFYSYKI